MSPEPENQAVEPSTAEAVEAEAPAESSVSVSDESLGDPAGEVGVEPVAAGEISEESAPAEAPAEGVTPEGVEPVATGEVSEESAPAEAPAEGAAPEAAEHPTESFDQLIEQYTVPQQVPAEGELIEGRVVAFTDLGVVIDVGSKTEALIPAQEFVEAPDLQLYPGQVVEVLPLHERKEDYALYSYLRARRRRAWENVEQSHRAHIALSGKVVDRIKGGLVVDIGIRAFLPASQVDIRPTRDLEAWKGQEIQCRVLKMNRKRGNVVVSRRVLLEEELLAQRERLLDSLVEGTVLAGTVKSITDYGVFVDLVGLDGLLHVTDMSWGRIKHPSEMVAVGQPIDVMVLKFDREKMRVSLGHKQLSPDPWESVPQRFRPGDRVYGIVVGITDYGAFVEIEPGIEGLVHISEMTWSKRMKHPSKIVSLGDQVEVVVLDVKPDQRRISLGLKQALPDPWQSLSEKYPVGSTVTGRVRNLTEFGAFMEIEDGIDGLIHVSDLSWTEKITHPSEVLKKGETVTAKVLKIDKVNRRLSLGMKQLNDIWAGWFSAHKVNDFVRGKVARATSFGVFVELAEGIEGLCHVSEIETRRGKGDAKQQRGSKSSGVTLEVGQEYEFKIIRIDPDQHRIGLSYRAAQKDADRRDMEQYRSSRSSSTATIGDMILSKRNVP
jgi:small subunit ribosomal protein S1